MKFIKQYIANCTGKSPYSKPLSNIISAPPPPPAKPRGLAGKIVAIVLIATFANSAYAQFTPAVESNYTITQGGMLTFPLADGGGTHRIVIHDDPNYTNGFIFSDIADSGLSFTESSRVLTATDSAAIRTYQLRYQRLGGGGVDLLEADFALRVCIAGGCPAPAAPSTAQRKSRDNDFENFATATAIGMLATAAWLTIKNHNPTITNKINFTAMPTSNKSLQYNLNANLNKSWSANFTVDKTVKINSDTTNSNHYKLEFKYQF